jgi:hypothetical protein
MPDEAAPGTAVYDPNDPGNHPAAGPPPPDVWIEGDHPTENPDGVTNSNHDYWPKTQEEKAELLGVEMVDPVDTQLDLPYETGSPPGEAARDEMMRRLHTPAERVEGGKRDELQAQQLKAGGAVEIEMSEDHPAA